MKLLFDNCVSEKIKKVLQMPGIESCHIRDFLPADSADLEIIVLAEREHAVVVTYDTDFGRLIAQGARSLPSIILLRDDALRRPGSLAEFLRRELPKLEQVLAEGALVVVRRDRVRVRALPIGG